MKTIKTYKVFDFNEYGEYYKFTFVSFGQYVIKNKSDRKYIVLYTSLKDIEKWKI